MTDKQQQPSLLGPPTHDPASPQAIEQRARLTKALEEMNDDRKRQSDAPVGPLFSGASESAPEPVPPSPAIEAQIERVAPPMPARKTSMHQTALVFLEDPLARKLAVAWTACGGDEAHWFEMAGVSDGTLEARRLAKALRANGICRDGGVTDEMALQYISVIATEPLKRRIREAQQEKARKA